MKNKILNYFLQLTCFFSCVCTLSAESKFLMLLPLSGTYSQVGMDGQQGIQAALSEIQSPLRARIIYADSQADPKLSISEFNKAIDLDNIFAAFVFRGPVGMTINPISKSKQIPVLGAVANKAYTLENPYAYQLWADSEAEAKFILDSALRLKVKNIALVTAEDDYPMAVSQDLKNIAEKTNFKITSSHDFASKETDFRTIALTMAKSKPDLIFANLGISQIAPFVKQVRQMKVKSKIISNFWMTKNEVLSALGKESEGLYSAEVATDYPKLNKDLKIRFSSSASSATVSAYVSTHLMNQALNLIDNKKIDKHSFQEALSKVHKVETPNGSFSMQNRKVHFPLSLKIIKDSKSVLYTD